MRMIDDATGEAPNPAPNRLDHSTRKENPQMTPPRPSRRSARLLRRFVLCLAATAAAIPARADVVTLIEGTTFKEAQGGAVRGTVQSESPAEVVVSLGNSTVRVPTDQIANIEYQGQPAAMQLGETRARAGQLAEAAAEFAKAATEAAGKPMIVEAARFREAKALAELALTDPNRVKEAVARLSTFLKTASKGRHAVAALETLAKLQVHAKDHQAAEAAVAELAKFPTAANQAAILKARILVERADFAAAAAELDRLIAALPEGSPQRLEARLTKVEALIGEKKLADAETLVRQVIADAPAEDDAAQAPAYNALGDCLAAADRPKEALLAYLHTDLLYAKDKEQHPRALRQIARLFRRLGQTNRADEYAQRLKQDYPNSPWAAAE